MNNNTKRWLYWLPRVLSILFALFISIFALDVFGEGYNFWETLVALFMHLVPTFILVAVIAIAWRWEKVGSLLFAVLAVTSLFTFKEGGWILSGPLLLVALLFLLNSAYNSRLEKQTATS